MTKTAGEARIIALAQKLNIKIITKKEGNDERTCKNEKVLPHRP